MEILFTAFLFGVLAGFIPGPILTSGFMTIIKNPKGLRYALFFPVIAGAIEIMIGVFLVHFGVLFLTNTVLIILTVLGVVNILYIAYEIFKTRKTFSLFSDSANYSSISYKQAATMTFLNGPLYMFWIMVCIPLAIEAKSKIVNGDILFVFIMVIGVGIATALLFLAMHKYRYFFQNEKIMKFIPYFISLFFVFIGLKMMATLPALI